MKEIIEAVKASGLHFILEKGGLLYSVAVMTPFGVLEIRDCDTFLALRFTEPRWAESLVLEESTSMSPTLLGGSFNLCSGKWNIHAEREEALKELGRRLEWVKTNSFVSVPA